MNTQTMDASVQDWGADPLFLQAEHLARDFSLFPRQNSQALSVQLDGLMDIAEAIRRLGEIRQLGVDEYVNRVILPAHHSKRPGARSVIASLGGQLIREEADGPFYRAEIELPFGSGTRRLGVIAQERGFAQGSWRPNHHLLGCAAIREFAELSLPIIFFIDTPGADAGEDSNRHNQAHSISRMIVESTHVDVPTVGIVLGVGYSGGAIPLAATNILLSVRDGIFNTIQPAGLQSIARKFNLSWQECARAVGVAPEELWGQRCLDGIIDYSPVDRDARQHNLRRAIISSVEAIEAGAVHHFLNTPGIMVHYRKSLARFVQTSGSASVSPIGLAKHPTMLPSPIRQCYRNMRYLTLRGRIHSASSHQIARLSRRTLPAGGLRQRLAADRRKAFEIWLQKPDKLVYHDHLVRSWEDFLAKRSQLGEARGTLARLILGKPKDQYEKAVHALLFNISFTLYNHWKSAAADNFRSLAKYLATYPGSAACPPPESWPSINQITLLDVISHRELRSSFIAQIRNLLLFDALYDRVVSRLDLIAREAMEHQRVSRARVGELLTESLVAVAGLVAENTLDDSVSAGAQPAGPAPSPQDADARASFEQWLRYFVGRSERGEFLHKIEQWKSVGHPQMNDALFVILTYYFERLLPEYFETADGAEFSGLIRPYRIGRKKDFWHRLTLGYRDLLIQRLLVQNKKKNQLQPETLIHCFFKDFVEIDADRTTSDPIGFPGFREAVDKALSQGVRACGLVTGTAQVNLPGLDRRPVALAVSNVEFQAGAFDMASAEKFCRLLVTAAQSHLPVICFVSSGGMQTKEGAAALFSMAIVNDRITRFVRDNGLPVVVFGFGDCTGGAQASFVTHPLVSTYYFSGTNMPFAGQMVVPAYLPSTSTLSNYLVDVEGSMKGLVVHPMWPELDARLKEIDPRIAAATLSVAAVLDSELSDSPQPESANDETAEFTPDARTLMRPIRKVLIHARGCTAQKLIQVAQENQIAVVLTASEPDMSSVPAQMLGERDKLVGLGGSTSDESYLNPYSILRVAEYEGVDALHPGIGFLSESPQFASLCTHNGINFIGPSAASMLTMGNKSNAVQTARDCKVPVVPGSHGVLGSVDQANDIAAEIGFPVLLKAVYGGGGKGIKPIHSHEEMLQFYEQVRAEARAAFGYGDLYLEKFIKSMRHVEVQILRDSHANTRILGLRDCSVQRKNQKLIEESGSAILPAELKRAAFDYAERLADQVDYVGAGTVEFIYDIAAGALYFMEMNTRLQVEHPVTECTSGVDIVRAQFDIASGGSIAGLQPLESGYAMELRITAEKPVIGPDGLDFKPDPGAIEFCSLPQQKDIRVISIARTGVEIPPFYDSLIAQVIASGRDREEVIHKLLAYLDSCVIEGISTNIPVLKRILRDEEFVRGAYDVGYLASLMTRVDGRALVEEVESASRKHGAKVLSLESVRVCDGDEYKVLADCSGLVYSAASPNDVPYVQVGDTVSSKSTLFLVEAMKMFRQVSLRDFNTGTHPLFPEEHQYRIEQITFHDGQQIAKGDLLFIVSIVPAEAAAVAISMTGT